MSEAYIYDKAKYHMTGTKCGATSWEKASGSVLFMLRWLIDHDLLRGTHASCAMEHYNEFLISQ